MSAVLDVLACLAWVCLVPFARVVLGRDHLADAVAGSVIGVCVAITQTMVRPRAVGAWRGRTCVLV